MTAVTQIMRIIRQVSSFTALHLSACITALLYDVTGIIAITVKISAGAAGQPAAPVLMPLGWFAQRANQTTTRYAGVRKKLYKKIPLSSTIRLFKS